MRCILLRLEPLCAPARQFITLPGSCSSSQGLYESPAHGWQQPRCPGGQQVHLAVSNPPHINISNTIMIVGLLGSPGDHSPEGMTRMTRALGAQA